MVPHSTGEPEQEPVSFGRSLSRWKVVKAKTRFSLLVSQKIFIWKGAGAGKRYLEQESVKSGPILHHRFYKKNNKILRRCYSVSWALVKSLAARHQQDSGAAGGDNASQQLAIPPPPTR